MNEQYLHLLWKTGRLPMHRLKTIHGKELRILHAGFHNTGSGPDFFSGRIELDGLQHSGNIELHVKSSDWYAHGHHNDPAYDNVILHVVYEHDKPVFIQDEPVPALELRELVDLAHFRKTMSLLGRQAVVPCERQLAGDIPVPVFWNQTEQALFRRLERKSWEVKELAFQLRQDPKKVLFHVIARAFGMRTNQLPFEELAHRVPFERLIRASKQQVESIVFGTGGLLQERFPDDYQERLQREWFYQAHRLNLEPVRRHSWHFKGCRPAGYPTLRLAQFAAFISRMDWSSSFWELPAEELRSYLEQQLTAAPSAYWKVHYDFGKQRRGGRTAAMSKEAARVVVINSIVPFLWWFSDWSAQPVYREKALELLELLPPEKNAVTAFWKEKGFIAKSAGETQGLIELKNEFCARKQCLNCRIGQHLLKR